MRILELFAGTGSVGKVFKEWGYADIKTDIMDLDYKAYEPGRFDVVWASPMHGV